MKRILAIVFLLIPILSDAQSEKLKKHQQTKHFEPTQKLQTEEFVSNYYQELGLEKPEDLKQKVQNKTKNNWTRTRYSQEYKGLEVIGGTYVVHAQNNIVKKSTGTLLPNIDLDTEAGKSVNEIYNALRIQLLKKKKIESQNIKAFLEDLSIENHTLCIIDSAYPNFSGNYRLAYKVVASNIHPGYDRADYILDASTGKLIFTNSHVCSSSVEGVAKTRYYGEQTITVDSLSPDRYVMFDEERAVHTLNWNEEDLSAPYGYAFFEDEDNYWDNANEDLDEVAGDLHYCSSAYHDFMLDKFGWKGIDGLGGDLVGIAHVGGKYFLNAFWNGVATFYGNGRCVDYGPLTTLDVVGHEYAHGFTDFTSDLIYQDESGALNESISDILGKALEYEYDQANFNWYIGDRFTDEGVNSFRNMADPNEFNDPKFYRGQFWVTDPNFDRGGVHINSGLYNYWFHLLVEGGAGTNEANVDFDVAAIGWEDALDIVVGVQMAYFGPSTNYFQAYAHTLEYTRDAYGEQSMQYRSVEEAWRAVGIDDTLNGEVSLAGGIDNTTTVEIFCEDDCQFIDIDLTNLSIETLQTGQEIFLSYEVNGVLLAEEILTLNQDLESGNSVPYIFDRPVCTSDFLSLNNVSFEVKYAVNAVDEKLSLFETRFEESDASGIDLELVSADLNYNICNPEFADFFLFLRNTGCKSVISGSYDVALEINGTVYPESIFFFDDILPGANEISFLFPNLPSLVNTVNEYSLTIDIPDDSNSVNNSATGTFTSHKTMGQNVEEFTNYQDQNSEWIQVVPNFRNFVSTLDVDGDQKLIIGGSSNFNFFRPCPEAEDLFADSGAETEMNICFDTEGMTNPVLRYEYTPYYSGGVDDVPEEFGSMTQLSVSDDFSADPVLYDPILGLPEGEESTIMFDLPVTTGELTIAVISMQGNQNDALSGNLNEGDYQIFDNIRIEEKGMVAVEEEILHAGMHVYPNPSNGRVNFTHEAQDAFTLKIFTLDGKEILNQDNIRSNYTWTPSEPFSGILFYQVKFEGGETTRGKLIMN